MKLTKIYPSKWIQSSKLKTCLFWPLFGPRRATFETFWVWQMAQTGLYGCLHRCSNLVPPLPTQNLPSWLIFVAKWLFLAYFGPFLIPVGPHLKPSGSGKWAKLITSDVISAVATLMQPVPLKRGSHMAIILKMQILTLFGPL